MPLRDVEGGQPAVRLVVDSVELPGDVEGLAVLGDGQAPARAVEAGSEVLDELPGVDVVGQDVGARNLLLSLGRLGRAGGFEVADDVDHIADDELAPGDAVDLCGRQGRGCVRRLLGRLAGRLGALAGGACVVSGLTLTVVVSKAGIGVDLTLILRRRHRCGGGEGNHEGEEEREEGQDDEDAGGVGATLHGNLREIWLRMCTQVGGTSTVWRLCIGGIQRNVFGTRRHSTTDNLGLI